MLTREMYSSLKEYGRTKRVMQELYTSVLVMIKNQHAIPDLYNNPRYARSLHKLWTKIRNRIREAQRVLVLRGNMLPAEAGHDAEFLAKIHSVLQKGEQDICRYIQNGKVSWKSIELFLFGQRDDVAALCQEWKSRETIRGADPIAGLQRSA